MKKKVVPTLRQEVKVKVDIVTSDDIKIYYTGKFQDFTARYIIISFNGWKLLQRWQSSANALNMHQYEKFLLARVEMLFNTCTVFLPLFGL